jgi:hypothetical protein
MRKLAVAAITMALAGCGGGGGDGSSSAPPPNLQSVPVQTALLAGDTPTSAPITLHASDSQGNAFTLVYTVAPDSAPPVPGIVQLSVCPCSLTTVAITGTDGTAWNQSVENVYVADPFMPQGSLGTLASLSTIGGYGGDFSGVTSWTPPSTLTVGDSGQFYSATWYSSLIFSTLGKLSSEGTEADTYAVSAYSPTAVEVQVTVDQTFTSPYSWSTAYAVDAEGNSTLLSITVSFINEAFSVETLTFTP